MFWDHRLSLTSTRACLSFFFFFFSPRKIKKKKIGYNQGMYQQNSYLCTILVFYMIWKTMIEVLSIWWLIGASAIKLISLRNRVYFCPSFEVIVVINFFFGFFSLKKNVGIFVRCCTFLWSFVIAESRYRQFSQIILRCSVYIFVFQSKILFEF